MDFKFKKFFFNNKETDFHNLPHDQQQKINQAFDTMNKFFDGNLNSQGSPIKVVHLNNQGHSSFSPLGSRFSSSKRFAIFGGVFFSLLLALLIILLPSLLRESYDIKGDVTHFDPFAAVNDIRSYLGPGIHLESMIIRYVRSDGTVDLTAKYEPRVNYEFFRELPNPPGNALPGSTKWYEPVSVNIQAPGLKTLTFSSNGKMSMNFVYSKGIDVKRLSPVSSATYTNDPSCLIKDLWKRAIEKGASADGVATIMYTSSGKYIFSIEGSNISFIADNCK